MESVEKEKTIDDRKGPRDCLSCKLLSGSVLLIASVYVFTRGVQARFRSTKLISAMFGTSLCYTGAARLLDLYPFNVNQELSQPNSPQ